MQSLWMIAASLLFACMGAEPAHQREVIQKYLRIGSVMTSGK